MKKILLIIPIVLMLMALSGCFFTNEDRKEDTRQIDESKEILTYIKTRYKE